MRCAKRRLNSIQLIWSRILQSKESLSASRDRVDRFDEATNTPPELNRGQTEDMRNIMTSTLFTNSCTTICIKCRRRCNACICRAGKPDDPRAVAIDRAHLAREIGVVTRNSGPRAIDRERDADSRVAGSNRYSDRSRIVAVGSRKTCRHDALDTFQIPRDNNQRAKSLHLFLAASPKRKEATHHQRVFDGCNRRRSCGNDINIRPSMAVAPILPFHCGRRAMISDYCTHLLHVTHRTCGVGGVTRLSRFQCNQNTHALRNADRPPRFAGSAQAHTLYGRHRLYFRINSRIWPDSLPRAPDGPSRATRYTARRSVADKRTRMPTVHPI